MKKKLPILKTDKEAEKFVDTAYLSEYDLSSYAPQAAPSAAAPKLNVGIYFWHDSAAPQTVYVDDVIITQNEP